MKGLVMTFEYPAGVRVGEIHYSNRPTRTELRIDAGEFAARTARPYVWARFDHDTIKVTARVEVSVYGERL